MISVEGIAAGYGRDMVLSDVSLKVESGEFVGMIGPNGCGKTTLLRVISGVLAPVSGRVTLDGEDVRRIPRRRMAQSVACLAQEVTLDFPFTVREVVLMGRSPHLPRLGWERGRDHDIAEQAMELADVAHLAERHITELSGGERQRAFLAMCLAQQPKVLLLDEPTNHLDISHVLAALELIRRLNRETDVTVVAVFHDLNLASEYCDRIAAMKAGRIQAVGEPAEVVCSDMIRQVYGAEVRTEANPVSGKPHVLITAEPHLYED